MSGEVRETDFVKSFPFATLEQAAKLNLLGGGAQLFAALWVLWQDNRTEWQTPTVFYVLLLGGAVITALAAAVLKVVDAVLRTKMASELLKYKGTTDASKVNSGTPTPPVDPAALVRDLVGKGVVLYAIQPTDN